MMIVDDLERLRYNMEKSVKRTVDEYNAKDENLYKIAEPIIGYVNTDDPRFDAFFTRKLCHHPRAVYRPGHCAMVYYLPFAEDCVGNYDAFYAGMRLSMEVNRAIRHELDEMGRLSSLCSSMADWSKERCHYEWDSKIAAYIAGIGEFGTGGSFHTAKGCSGRVGVVIFDKQFAPDIKEYDNSQLEAVIDEYMRDCGFNGASSLECSNELIAVCPGNAISKDGIDRKLCQEYCMTINRALPDPELCGKCFKLK